MNIIDISLVSCCNFRCEYCINKESMHATHQKHGEFRAYQLNGPTIKQTKLLEFLEHHFSPADTIINITGGEPMLHDSFFNILTSCALRGFIVFVNTNGSMMRDYPNETNHVSKIPNIFWRITWHPTCKSIEGFKKDISCLDSKAKILIEYVAHPARIETGIITQDILSLKDLNIHFNVSPFVGKWADKEYVKWDKIYNNFTNPMVLPENTIPPLLKNYFSIKSNGNIYKCHSGDIIGNIYSNNLMKNQLNCGQLCKYDNGNSYCGIDIAYYYYNLYK